jgi:hypothetical protein
MAAFKSLCVLLLAAVAAFFMAAPMAAEAKGFWCHKSGYDGVACAKGKAAKRAIFAKCAKPLKIQLSVREEKCTRRPGRCSYTLVQVLKGNKATWDKFSACERKQKIYTTTFTRRGANLGNNICKYDKAC